MLRRPIETTSETGKVLYNVFDVGSGHWVLPFDITVALLVVFQLAGLSAAVRMLGWRA